MCDTAVAIAAQHLGDRHLVATEPLAFVAAWPPDASMLDELLQGVEARPVVDVADQTVAGFSQSPRQVAGVDLAICAITWSSA